MASAHEIDNQALEHDLCPLQVVKMVIEGWIVTLSASSADVVNGVAFGLGLTGKVSCPRLSPGPTKAVNT